MVSTPPSVCITSGWYWVGAVGDAGARGGGYDIAGLVATRVFLYEGLAP